MTPSTEVFIGALAIAAGLWSHVKAVFAWWLKSLLVVTVWLDEDALKVIVAYAQAHGRRFASQTAYAVDGLYVRPLGRTQSVAWEWLTRTAAVLWLRRRPLWIGKPDKPLQENYLTYTLSVIRGTVDIERLLITATEWAGAYCGEGAYERGRHVVTYHQGATLKADDHNATPHEKREPGRRWSKHSGRRLLNWKPEDIGGTNASASFDALVMMPEIAALTAEIRAWFTDRTWYQEHNVPWRMGCAYEGPPGTGKTSHARSLAVELDLPVHVFDIATMSNHDLREAWAKMVADAPCMALIEDIDNVFDGRVSIAPPTGMAGSGGLTFDALLNAIDGIERNDGVLLIITSNHLDKLDPALRDRKGRIDRVVHFGPLDTERRIELARRIISDAGLAEQTAIESGSMPASKFARLCCDVALAERRGDVRLAAVAYR